MAVAHVSSRGRGCWPTDCDLDQSAESGATRTVPRITSGKIHPVKTATSMAPLDEPIGVSRNREPVEEPLQGEARQDEVGILAALSRDVEQALADRRAKVCGRLLHESVSRYGAASPGPDARADRGRGQCGPQRTEGLQGRAVGVVGRLPSPGGPGGRRPPRNPREGHRPRVPGDVGMPQRPPGLCFCDPRTSARARRVREVTRAGVPRVSAPAFLGDGPCRAARLRGSVPRTVRLGRVGVLDRVAASRAQARAADGRPGGTATSLAPSAQPGIPRIGPLGAGR